MDKDRDGYLTDPEWRGVETGITCPSECTEGMRWLERFVQSEPALCLRMQYGDKAAAFWHYQPLIGAQSRAMVWRQSGWKGERAAERLADDLRTKGLP